VNYRDAKEVLFTTLHLLNFKECMGATETPIYPKEAAARGLDVTAALKVKDRFEVNLIVGVQEGKPCVPMWVMDYQSKLAKANSQHDDLWRLAVAHDETYDSFEAAQEAAVWLVENLMRGTEPTEASNLDTAHPTNHMSGDIEL
jgi:hypothetical protein